MILYKRAELIKKKVLPLLAFATLDTDQKHKCSDKGFAKLKIA